MIANLKKRGAKTCNNLDYSRPRGTAFSCVNDITDLERDDFYGLICVDFRPQHVRERDFDDMGILLLSLSQVQDVQ